MVPQWARDVTPLLPRSSESDPSHYAIRHGERGSAARGCGSREAVRRCGRGGRRRRAGRPLRARARVPLRPRPGRARRRFRRRRRAGARLDRSRRRRAGARRGAARAGGRDARGAVRDGRGGRARAGCGRDRRGGRARTRSGGDERPELRAALEETHTAALAAAAHGEGLRIARTGYVDELADAARGLAAGAAGASGARRRALREPQRRGADPAEPLARAVWEVLERIAAAGSPEHFSEALGDAAPAISAFAEDVLEHYRAELDDEDGAA